MRRLLITFADVDHATSQEAPDIRKLVEIAQHGVSVVLPVVNASP
jgi:hypothetical protein